MSNRKKERRRTQSYEFNGLKARQERRKEDKGFINFSLW